MRLSDLIKKAQAALEKYGDVPIYEGPPEEGYWVTQHTSVSFDPVKTREPISQYSVDRLHFDYKSRDDGDVNGVVVEL